MNFIKEKSKISKNFPLKLRIVFSLKNMYLSPQGYTCSGSVSKKTWDNEKSRQKEDVYKNRYYTLYEQYYFRWLFLCLIFTVRLKEQSTVYIIEKEYRPDMDVEKLKYEAQRFQN